jgi:hypothetical protein
MSAPSEDPPSQPPTGSEKPADVASAAAAAPTTETSKPEDVEMPAAEEPDRFEDVPEHVLKVCFCFISLYHWTWADGIWG